MKYGRLASVALGATSMVVAAAGMASAADCSSGSGGASGPTMLAAGPSTDLGGSPVVVGAPQQGAALLNGPVADVRCVAPWSNGAVLGGTVALNSHYAACDSAPVDQAQNAEYKGGLLF